MQDNKNVGPGNTPASEALSQIQDAQVPTPKRFLHLKASNMLPMP
jgi:hypothetical protein